MQGQISYDASVFDYFSLMVISLCDDSYVVIMLYQLYGLCSINGLSEVNNADDSYWRAGETKV
jgi:hypothetical protein